jgi:hypothetical protein
MTTVDDDLIDDADDLVEASTVVKIAAPVIAFGAAWIVRKAMETAYTKATGHAPPKVSDPDARMVRIIVWAAATAATIAVVNVAVDRMTAPKRITS